MDFGASKETVDTDTIVDRNDKDLVVGSLNQTAPIRGRVSSIEPTTLNVDIDRKC